MQINSIAQKEHTTIITQSRCLKEDETREVWGNGKGDVLCKSRMSLSLHSLLIRDLPICDLPSPIFTLLHSYSKTLIAYAICDVAGIPYICHTSVYRPSQIIMTPRKLVVFTFIVKSFLIKFSNSNKYMSMAFEMIYSLYTMFNNHNFVYKFVIWIINGNKPAFWNIIVAAILSML